MTTSKYLTADLKFADNRKAKKEKKEKAAAAAAPKAQKLFDVMEQISWGL